MTQSKHDLKEVLFSATASELRFLNEHGYHIINKVRSNTYVALVTNIKQFDIALEKAYKYAELS